MKHHLKIEELLQFLAALHIVVMNDPPWWVYLLLVAGPDISMLGYAAGPRVGAVAYNLFHSKALAVVIAWGGHFIPGMDGVFLAGVVLYGHASMDRIFGYGLKYSDHFKHTHLGWIGGVAGQPAAGKAR
jgi:hypothetical protein